MDIEEKGTPTACMANSHGNFTIEANHHAKARGFPYLPIIGVNNSSSGPEEMRKETAKVLDEVAKVLTTPAEKLQKEYFEKWIPK